jgi:ATP diphosphatase
MRAEKLQKRAARTGFDWPNIDGVLDKITEEARELGEAITESDADHMEDEMGDLLFAVTNLARKIGVDPEIALRRTNQKFTARFEHIENAARSGGTDLNDMSLDEMEALWQEAKTLT